MAHPLSSLRRDAASTARPAASMGQGPSVLAAGSLDHYFASTSEAGDRGAQVATGSASRMDLRLATRVTSRDLIGSVFDADWV